MYGYMPMYYFDPTYVLIIIGVLLSMGASAKLNATYGRYSSVASRCGMTGAQAAQRILQSQGIYDVTVRHVSGRLTDHYDPRSKTVNLSDTVYGSTSIAAIGVAAHECGHAIQDARDYVPLRLRAALVPVANFGSQISWLLIILGIRRNRTDQSWHPYVFTGCSVPDHYTACRVQCFSQSGSAP